MGGVVLVGVVGVGSQACCLVLTTLVACLALVVKNVRFISIAVFGAVLLHVDVMPRCVV